MDWMQVVGLYFLLEGTANTLYWSAFPKTQGEKSLWQYGRVLRAVLGGILLIFA
jgi:hypothetical protein